MKYRFESIVFKDGQCMISGFALGNDPDAVLSYTVMDEYDNVIKADIRKLVRNDVSNKYLHRITDNEYGFSVSFPADPGRKYRMLVKAGMEQKIFRIDQNSAAFHNGLMKLRKNAFLRNLKDKIRNAGSGELTYNDWYNKTKITKEELSEQRKLIITDDMPLFSIVIPLYCTAEKYLCELIESILNQTYGKFELCLADGSPEDKKVEQIVRKYPDERIRYTFIGENRGISDNTNVAVEMASGDFIVLCDHDDLLPENALYEFALEIMKHPETDCIYSDEDKINQNGTHDVAQYASAEVSVPNTYAASDEGKVVHNGALTAQTSGTATENGTVDTTLINSLLVSVGGGGAHVASGTFTITAEANDNAPTITHNLNTQKIAVLIYPTSAKISTGDGYRNWYAELITVNQIANGNTWTFDWTSYNSKFSGDETVTLPDGNLRIGNVHQSPWPTQSHWYDAGNPAFISGLDSIELTDNTVRVKGTSNRRRWCCGTYNWIVAKME